MTEPILLGSADGAPFYLDLDVLLQSGAFVQGNSGSGKSGLLRRLLEESHGRVQQIILDAEGDYVTLSMGYDYVLCGEGFPVPANVETAEVLALKLYESRVTAVVDISHLDLAGQQRFVRIFVEALMLHAGRLKSEQRHHVLVVVDELQVFAPEGERVESTAALVDLAHRGRRRALHPILATQRLSSVKKDAVSEIPNKLFGRTALDVDQKRVAQELGFDTATRRALGKLKTREFYAYGPALSPEEPVIITVADVKTPMPKIGELSSYTLPPPSKEVLAALEALNAASPAPVEELTSKGELTPRGKSSSTSAGVQNAAQNIPPTFLPCNHEAEIAQLFAEVERLKAARDSAEATATDYKDRLRALVREFDGLPVRLSNMTQVILAAYGELPIVEGETDAEAQASRPATRPNGVAPASHDLRPDRHNEAPPQHRASANHREREPETRTPSRPTAPKAPSPKGRSIEDMTEDEARAFMREEIARQLRDSNHVLVVPPAEVIRKDYLTKAIDRYMGDVRELSPDAQELYRWLVSRGTFLSVSQASTVLSGYVSGTSNGKWSAAVKELLSAGMVVKGGSGGDKYKASTDEARARVVKALEPYLATDAEVEEVYQAVLGRIAGEGVLV